MLPSKKQLHCQGRVSQEGDSASGDTGFPATSSVVKMNLVGYAAQLLCVAVFFCGGLLLSIFWRLRMRLGAVPPLAARREGFSGCLNRYFSLMRKWGLMQLHASGFDAIKDARGIILVANHPGLFDALFILSVFPHAACIMRSSLMRHPCMGGVARWCEFIPNDAGGEFIRRSLEKIREGDNLLFFPEGTRTDLNKTLNRFKKGFALIATKSAAPVFCIHIRQSARFLRKGVSLLEPAAIPITFELVGGGFFNPEPGERAGAFSQRLEHQFRDPEIPFSPLQDSQHASGGSKD